MQNLMSMGLVLRCWLSDDVMEVIKPVRYERHNKLQGGRADG